MAETRKVRTHGSAETRKVSTPIYSSLLPFRHPPVLTFRVFGEAEARRASGETERTQAPSNRGARNEYARRGDGADLANGRTRTRPRERRDRGRNVHAIAYRTNMLPWVPPMPPPGIADAVVPGPLLLLGFQSGLRGKVKGEVNTDAR